MTGPDLIPVVLAEICDRRQWVESVTSTHAKPVLQRGLGAIHWRLPGLGSEAVARVVGH